MNQNSTIVFVCEHGAAKSIVAATYFNKLADERNLNVRALARGTHPDPELSPKTIAGLSEDGLTPTESKPQQLSPADLESARFIVSFCELPEEFQNQIPAERWDDVPPISEDYSNARNAILKKLQHLPQFSNP